MSSRFKAARSGALLLAVATALLVAAPPALAATAGEYVGGVDGESVRIGGHTDPIPTSLLRLSLDNDGQELLTYCVDLDVSARLGARMTEAPWSAYPDKAETFAAQPDKVLWVLHHSYPNVGLADLSNAAGVELSERQAIAGTQAAIWHFSNDAVLDGDNPEAIQRLYKYLTDAAINTGIGDQPPASLSLTPELVENVDAGQTAGSFMVDSTAGDVQLTVEGPDGVEIVNSVGDTIQPLDRDIFSVQPFDRDIFSVNEFWLSPPTDGKAGEAIVRATAQATVEVGRLFVGEDENNPTQSAIAASSIETTATAEARASWIGGPLSPPSSSTTTATPTTTTTSSKPSTSTTTAAVMPISVAPTTTVSPAPQARGLPLTGASVLPILAVGALLVAAGVGALLLQRKLRRTN
jgi:TQXA domain-containing protein